MKSSKILFAIFSVLFSLVLVNFQLGNAVFSSSCSCEDEAHWMVPDGVPASADGVPASAVTKSISDDELASTNTIEFDYIPASTETYLVENMKRLKLDGDNRKKVKDYKGCTIWKDKTVAPEIYDDLQKFREELRSYHKFIDKMKPLPNALKSIIKTNDHTVCDAMRLHPDGLPGFFPSNQLSYGIAGYAEPLLTPMRHPEFCFQKRDTKHTMDMKYMVFDFEKLCRNLKPHSRIVLIDMGASLTFHSGKTSTIPIMYLIKLFEKFGFRFDHIYGIEIKFQEPEKVYNKLIPPEYLDSYHWINVGVSAEKGHKMNPLDSILRKFTPDDLVLVKLDIDTSDIEVPLAHQLLKDESLHEIVDHFFFEHHVLLQEIMYAWRGSAKGSVKSSFDLFQRLREKGVMSHFWP